MNFIVQASRGYGSRSWHALVWSFLPIFCHVRVIRKNIYIYILETKILENLMFKFQKDHPCLTKIGPENIHKGELGVPLFLQQPLLQL